MDKVSSKLPSWQTTKTTSKKGFDKVWGWADKLGAPVNRLSNRIGSEAFWPMTLDKESDKAARILRSFCKDGFYADADAASEAEDKAEDKAGDKADDKVDDKADDEKTDGKPSKPPAGSGPRQKQRVLKKIPQHVIQRAVGLAIFTTMRTGLWISGAGGSGVLVARNEEDGSWSPPSGILLHTAGLGFLVGVDIYDCVLVINSRAALAAFTTVRATLGGEISAVAGPVGAGGVMENDGHWKDGGKAGSRRPVFAYLKSRGFYAGVQVDGTIVVARSDENRRFYGSDRSDSKPRDEPPVAVPDILAGRVPWQHRAKELRLLMETLKAAEGRTDFDAALLDATADQPAPGDVDVDAPGGSPASPLFGVPAPDDPDPYGVLALEHQGLAIREAATRSRPPSQQFAFNPSPTSPVYGAFHRQSASVQSNGTKQRSFSIARSRRTVDAEVQTDPVVILDLPDAEPSVTDDVPREDGEEDERSVYEDVADTVDHTAVVLDDKEPPDGSEKQERTPDLLDAAAHNPWKANGDGEAPKDGVDPKADEKKADEVEGGANGKADGTEGSTEDVEAQKEVKSDEREDKENTEAPDSAAAPPPQPPRERPEFEEVDLNKDTKHEAGTQ